MAEELGFREFPFRGEVSKVRVVGDGKDCVLQVWVPNGSAFAIPLSSARSCVSCGEGVVVDTRALDDVSLEISYRPAAGRRMRVADAKVCYPGSEDDWACDCESWKRMSRSRWPQESSWAVLAVELTLTTWADPGTAEGASRDA